MIGSGVNFRMLSTVPKRAQRINYEIMKSLNRRDDNLMTRVGLQKNILKIKGTRNYYFKTIGYCSRTKVKSPLILIGFYATGPRP